MKRSIIITLIVLAATSCVMAQEYKVNKSGGKIVLNLSSALVEGYSGSQIIFSSQREQKEEPDPRAKGLQAINGSGFTDNTGLGVSVMEKGTTVEVNQVLPDVAIRIQVPKGMIVSFACHKVNADKVIFKNMENEIEISTDYNPVELENVAGPLSIRSVYGGIDVRFSTPVKGPVSITSVYSTVDVAIPSDTKANIKLNTSYGSILASAELKIELEKNADGDMISYGNIVNGKINGGGTEFKLTSEYSKIYLRKTK